MRRFLSHWRPSAAIFTEGEIWPTTLRALAAASVPCVHINARLSDRTFAAWRRWPSTARGVFGCIELALAQSDVQAERFAALGARATRTTGNLKFDAPPLPIDRASHDALRAATAARPVWLAASTHPGEEEVVFAAHHHLARVRPDLLTIVAPRHADRGPELVKLANGTWPDAPQTGRVTRRAAGEGPEGGIYVADTMGELGTLFALSPVVLLGGSLVALGGHNPAEPAAAGVALLTGPSYGPMFTPFLDANAAFSVDADAKTLAAAVAKLFDDPAACREFGVRAQAVLARERGAVDRTMAALAGVL